MKTKLFFSVSLFAVFFINNLPHVNAQKQAVIGGRNAIKVDKSTIAIEASPASQNYKEGSAKRDTSGNTDIVIISSKKPDGKELLPRLISDLQKLQALIHTQQKQSREWLQKMKAPSAVVPADKMKSALPIAKADGNNAYLEQDVPNPLSHASSIGYYIPEGFSKAELQITDMAGGLLKTYPVTHGGYNRQVVANNSLTSGVYQYSLWVDGKLIDTKCLMLLKYEVLKPTIILTAPSKCLQKWKQNTRKV